VGPVSARSIEGFHLYDAIKSISHMLSRFGGHKAAAGLSIDPARIPEFTAAFEAVALAQLDESALVPRCRIDAVVATGELDEKTVTALLRLAPFGMGNPEPVLALREQVTRPRVLQNKTPGEPGHLKLAIESSPQFDVIGFRQGDKVGLTDGPVDLAFKLSIDEFRGQKRLSLKLTSLRSSRA
jgi:single-stranded-DNA-specific exonuclease